MSKLTDDGLLTERTNGGLGGSQRIYRWGQWGLSLIDSPRAHSYPFAWEAAVIKFTADGADHWSINYESGLTTDVEVFMTDAETDEFINRAKIAFADLQQKN